MKSVVNNSFIIFSFGVVGMFLLPDLLKEGIFMDGLIYTTVAHNMYLGVGDIWHPVFTQTFMNEFAEHPTLAMWLQSLFYYVFGDFLFVDKLYSLFIGLLNFGVIILFWKNTVKEEIRNMYWWPTFLFIMVPNVSWVINNNMLENTMMLFSMVATFLLFKSVRANTRDRILLIVGASVLLVASFLSKGFPGLFPLGFYVVYYAVYHKEFSFKSMFLSSFGLIVSFAVLAFLFLYVNEDALAQLTRYLDKQVLSSLEGKRAVGSRLHIVSVFGSKIVISLLFALIVALVVYKKNIKALFDNSRINKLSLLFFLIGISASAPIMVSPKQLDFYIVPSMPFFVLALALISAKPLSILVNRIKVKSKGFLAFRILGGVLILTSIGLMISGIGKYSREKEIIQDVDIISMYLNEPSLISISEKHKLHWSLRSYFQRKYGSSLSLYVKDLPYILIYKTETIPDGYFKVPLPTTGYDLLQKEGS